MRIVARITQAYTLSMKNALIESRMDSRNVADSFLHSSASIVFNVSESADLLELGIMGLLLLCRVKNLNVRADSRFYYLCDQEKVHNIR